MHYPELAAENRRLKETEEGARQMESVVDRIFVEGREEGREEGRQEGNISTLYELYKDGLLSLDHVLAKVNMSEPDFIKKAEKIAKAH